MNSKTNTAAKENSMIPRCKGKMTKHQASILRTMDGLGSVTAASMGVTRGPLRLLLERGYVKEWDDNWSITQMGKDWVAANE